MKRPQLGVVVVGEDILEVIVVVVDIVERGRKGHF